MASYIIKSKNPRYSGVTFGLQFRNGQAILSDETLPRHLGYTDMEPILRGFYDFGSYEIIPAGMTLTARMERMIAQVVETEDEGAHMRRGSKEYKK